MNTKNKLLELKISLNTYSKEYGVGYSRVKNISISKGSNPRLNIIFLKAKTTADIQEYFLSVIDIHLKKKISYKIFHLINLKIYKGFRHAAHLPARGQRTHTNSKTKKKFKLTKF
jgi:small subunit ribosomal protein S13